MTVNEFLAWLAEAPEWERSELVAGEPVAIASGPVAHARVKAQV